jgi:hypothetical protein
MKQSKRPPNKLAANKLASNKSASKGLMILLVLALLYTMGQPLANRQFGWNLPSLAAFLPERNPDPAEPKPEPNGPLQPTPADSSGSKSTSPETSSGTSPVREPQREPPLPPAATRKPSAEKPEPQPPLPDTNLSKQPSEASSPGSEDNGQERLLHGILRTVGREEYQSPAGLRYTRGSVEGHRLQHLAKHLEDQPERSGRHGVFRGDMAQTLTWIDQAYTRANERKPKTSIRKEDERTVYEVTFEQPIGYIGGREGKRLNRPTTAKLRLVTEEDRVITAFPY